MSFFKEIKAVLVPKEIVFKEMKIEEEDIFTFVFETDKSLEWSAGKHAMFFIKHQKISKPMRLFSISSSPSEKNIAITTRIGNNPSEYKKALLELEPGMKMKLRGPMGPFDFQKGKINCFIAGGIGITPFRSMMKEVDNNKRSFNGIIKLLYIDNNKFLFNKELAAINNEKISVEFFTDIEIMHSRIKQLASKKDDITFFIAGTRRTTASIRQMLKKQGIKRKNIKIDTFIGY